MTVLEFKLLSLKFEEQQVFRDINFSIEKGDKVVISGDSGSGKSSLLKSVLGFNIPYDGDILFNQEILSSQNSWKFRKELAYVSQDLDIGEGNVGEFIMQVFNLKANKHLTFSQDELTKHLDYFHLHPTILGKEINTLSGGEKQRVAIILAILLKRKIYLLDEITSALDKTIKALAIDYFMKDSSTCIIISHDKEWINQKGIKELNLEHFKV